MRIEIRHHALDGGVDQFAVLDGAYIVGAHPLESVAEEIKLAIGRRVVGAPRLRQRKQCCSETTGQTQTQQRKLFHVRLAFPNAGRKFNFSQGAGD
jgi:hypothetical protein